MLPQVASELGSDIQILPSLETHLQRQAKLSGSRSKEYKELPEGFLPRVEGPYVWSKPRVEQFEVLLLPKEIDEINAAVKACRQIPFNELSPNTFPLPYLGPRLRGLSSVIYEGSGALVSLKYTTSSRPLGQMSYVF